MCYKEELQQKNEYKLQRSLDEYNVPEFIQDYFLNLASRVARVNYWSTIKKMLLWMIDKNYISKGSISEITLEDLCSISKTKMHKYFEYMKYEEKISLKTIGTKKYQLSSFWEELIELADGNCKNIVKEIKSEEFKPATTNRLKLQKMPKKQDMEEMIERINQKHDEFTRTRNLDIIRVLRGTGLRLSELVGLDLDDILLHGNEESEYNPCLFVISKGTYDYTDKGKDIVYLTQDAASAFQEWFDYRKQYGNNHEIFDTQAVFINKNGKRIAQHNVQRLFESYSDGKITPHMIRHEYITMLSQDYDIAFVQEQARHKSATITVGTYDSGARKALQRFSGK